MRVPPTAASRVDDVERNVRQIAGKPLRAGLVVLDLVRLPVGQILGIVGHIFQFAATAIGLPGWVALCVCPPGKTMIVPSRHFWTLVLASYQE